MTDAPSPTQVFRDARDLLLRYRADYPAALAGFSWPQLDQFNWALDWFDVIAAEHPDRDALRIVADGDAAAPGLSRGHAERQQPGGGRHRGSHDEFAHYCPPFRCLPSLTILCTGHCG